ncbi:hypothetical protein [Salinicoccus kekensis]|uniref:hypothetical protein n=1 Tax=Salinicoccus kekensis TaxID=714307 RepID=UPI0015C74988|nr:hypothetical protein [Salinicoccus kekensis]
MERLNRKVAIITASASGMDLAGAQIFIKEGIEVVLTDVADKLQDRVGEITADDGWISN